MADTPQAPDTKSGAWSRQERAAAIARDAYDGPLAIRDAGKTYLPQFPRESPEAYKDRLETSLFYDWTARTVNALTGMVFRKPPKLSDGIPEQIVALWEDIDARGTHGDVFCRRRHRDGEVDGHFCIFVDMQRGVDAVTNAEEIQAGLRPYWTGVRKMAVYGFEEITVAGKTLLSHLRFGETVTERSGYQEAEVERVREYNLVPATDPSGRVTRQVEFTIWAKRGTEDGRAAWVVDERGVMYRRLAPGRPAVPMDEIPLAVGYVGEEVGTLESKPPHLALALENIKHYQLTSDNDNVLHLCSVPVFVRIGYQEPGADDARSPNAGLDLPGDANADAKYVEPAGTGLEAAERRIAKSEQRMALLGLSMLMSESRAAETATSKRIDKAETDSALSSHARATQDAIEEAVRLTAKWLGVEQEMPGRTNDSRWVALNTDFERLVMDAPTITALSNLVATGQLTLETLWSMLERAEVLPADFDPEVERSNLTEGLTMTAPEPVLDRAA